VHCLDTLAAVLKEFGSSLEKVLKADVHLVDPSEFIEFKARLTGVFPQDPPARTTVEVGDTFPFRGSASISMRWRL
jgi:2-iminobutanoate/2-iminopropanoate deaminase